MTRRPRLRLTLPPLSPREALTLSYLVDTFDTLLWAHYGDAMVALLNEEPCARALVVDRSGGGSIESHTAGAQECAPHGPTP